MEEGKLFQIHIQQRTENGEWEELLTMETPGYVLMAGNLTGDGMESSVMNVSDRDIALFLVHQPTIRKVVRQALPAIIAADMLDEQKETQPEMDAEAMLTQLDARGHGGMNGADPGEEARRK